MSGILYPILILTLFLVVQILTMMSSRKAVLDKNKQQLLDSVNRSNKVYTNEELSILISELMEQQEQTLDKVYPVGSIYISYNSTNPKSLFGGTWVNYGNGRMLKGISSGTAGNTGGASSVTLTTSNLPSHTHTVTAKGTISSTFTGTSVTTNSTGAHTHSLNAADALVFTSNKDGDILLSNNATNGNVRGTFAGNSIPNFRRYTDSSGAHSHTVTAKGTVSSTFTGTSVTTSSTGNASALNIENPYITVYMWRRTA